MGFDKKVLVLKQIDDGFNLCGKKISGICRLETEDGVCTLFLTVINAAAKDGFTYKLMLTDTEKIFFFDLGVRPTSFSAILPSNLNTKFCVGIFAVKDDIPLTVAYAKSDDFGYTISDFKRAVAEKCLSEKKKEKQKPAPCPTEIDDPAPIRPPYPPAPSPDPAETPEEEFPSPKSQEVLKEYNDEAVATENYYAFSDEIEQKLDAIKRWTYDNVRTEDGEPSFRSQEEKEESQPDACGTQNETDACQCDADKKGKPYFLTVKKELDNLFGKFPAEESLQKTFSGSKFVRINYSADAYYVVGLIKEKRKEKYVCYGIPGTYSENPPKELAGYCTFIPLSIFNLLGDGYWMMFQDAVTGECIKDTLKQ
ncbi:MAG: hypothetical protein IJW47_01885 [Clostridia bacterium]|nr:hypothetical protein [Clostridia bacterium]